MRALVHDYSGHPFQVQLSRALARRGHEVLHVHCSSYRSGKGALSRQDGDPPGLRIESIDLGADFDHSSPARRIGQELSYGGAFSRLAAQYRPEVVLATNDPLFAKARAARWFRQSGTPWVFWLQDLYSVAMGAYVASRLGLPGKVLGRSFEMIERRLLRQASAVVLITDDFRAELRQWRVPEERCHVIENWAPLEDLPALPKDNAWARHQRLHDRQVLLYSGTLGLKHDPRLLLALAERFRSDPAVRVVVVSEGRAATWLAEEAARVELDNLVLLPYQPYERLAEVLASADILLAMLEPDAGAFSVPSKILSYLCAGRPILAAMPAENLGARTIERAGAGVVVPPGDVEAFTLAAARLLDDGAARRRHGQQASSYAEKTFDIEAIVAQFEPILEEAAGKRRSTV